MTETGMSIFEHSLAFAESEAMIGSRLGLSLFGSQANKTASSSVEEGTVTKLFTKSEILQKMNTPPEVLLMGVSKLFSLFRLPRVEPWFARYARCQGATILPLAPQGVESYYTAETHMILMTTLSFVVQPEHSC